MSHQLEALSNDGHALLRIPIYILGSQIYRFQILLTVFTTYIQMRLWNLESALNFMTPVHKKGKLCYKYYDTFICECG